MTSESDPTRKLREHLTEWLQRFRAAESIAAFVQGQLETAEWQEGARRLLDVAGVPEEITGIIDQQVNRNLDEVKSAFPLMPVYPKLSDERVMAMGSGTVGASSSMIAALVEIVSLPGASPEIDRAIRNYTTRQQIEGRLTGARARLREHFPSLVDLFDLAEQKSKLAKGDAEQTPGAATEVRNLLDKVKGELFARARRGPSENMTWATMSERLCEADRRRSEILLDQEVLRGQLYTHLSDLLHRRTALHAKRLSVVWLLVVDHVFVVCGCI